MTDKSLDDLRQARQQLENELRAAMQEVGGGPQCPQFLLFC